MGSKTQDSAAQRTDERATTDLLEQKDVKIEEGLDAFVVIDGLPVVPKDSQAKLVKFLLKKLSTVGKTSEDAVYMPTNDAGMTEGYVEILEVITSARLTETDMPSLNFRPPNRPPPPRSSSTASPSTRSTPWP